MQVSAMVRLTQKLKQLSGYIIGRTSETQGQPHVVL